MTNSSGGNDTEIDFVAVGKEKRKYLRDVKVIPEELQHKLIVVDVEEQKLKKPVKKSKRVRWRVWKLKEKEMKEKFQESENWWTLIQRICGDLTRTEF